MLKKFLISMGLILSFCFSGYANAQYYAVSCIGLSDTYGGAWPPQPPAPNPPPPPTTCSGNVLPTLETGNFSMQGYYIWPVASGTSGWLTLHHVATGVNTNHPVTNASGSGTVWPSNNANYGDWTWKGRIAVNGQIIELTLQMFDWADLPDGWTTCAKNITTGVVYPCEHWNY